MVTSRKIREIHVGQMWSIADNHYGGRRYVWVVGTTDHINDPTAVGDRVSAVNVHTGRRSFMKASTLRKHWVCEQEAPADEQ